MKKMPDKPEYAGAGTWQVASADCCKPVIVSSDCFCEASKTSIDWISIDGASMPSLTPPRDRPRDLERNAEEEWVEFPISDVEREALVGYHLDK